MKNLTFFFIGSLSFGMMAFGQNLVPNPSFENLISCPEPFGGSIIYVEGWNSPTQGTSDIYSNCNTNFHYFHTPNNDVGYQLPKEGDNYAGIILGLFIREYIQIQLNETLEAGIKYCVKFYVSAADSCTYAVNNIGAYFSNSQIIENDIFYTLPFTPQINNDPLTNNLSNRLQWTEVYGEFIATGNEKYIIMGNFNSDDDTDTSLYNDGPMPFEFSYFYIDDVSVMNCGDVSLNEYLDEKFAVHFDPMKNTMSITSNHLNELHSIKLINLVGQSFPINFREVNLLGNKLTYDLKEFQNGIYYLSIKAKNNTLTKKIIINY